MRVHSQRRAGEGLLKGDLHFASLRPKAFCRMPSAAARCACWRRIPDGCPTISSRRRSSEGRELKGATVGILTLTEGSFFNWQEIALKHGLNIPTTTRSCRPPAPARAMASCSKARSTPPASIPWVYVARTPASTISAPHDTVGEWQFTTYNVNSDWAKANPAKAEGFLRALLRATDWIYRNKASVGGDRSTRDEHQGRIRRAAWDYYISTGTLTRDLAFSEVGLRKSSTRRSRPASCRHRAHSTCRTMW